MLATVLATARSSQILAALAYTAAGTEHDTHEYTSVRYPNTAHTLVVVEDDIADTEVLVDPATTM